MLLLEALAALPFLALLSALLWAAHPLLLPLGWGLIGAVAVWDTRRRLRTAGPAVPPRR